MRRIFYFQVTFSLALPSWLRLLKVPVDTFYGGESSPFSFPYSQPTPPPRRNHVNFFARSPAGLTNGLVRRHTFQVICVCVWVGVCVCVGRLEWSKGETGQTGFINRMLKPSQLSLQIPVVLELNKSNGLKLKPLVWAFAMGSCLGGKHKQSFFLH